MSDPFLGEIKLLSFNFAPKGWAQCNGQLLPINQNQALFALLGTLYGGDGRVTFALPDLRSRVPIHVADGYTQGQRIGENAHTLTAAEAPTHQHAAQGTTSNSDADIPVGNLLGAANNMYAPAGNPVPLHPSTITNTGNGQPHENRQPFLGVTMAIALQGIFPSMGT